MAHKINTRQPRPWISDARKLALAGISTLSVTVTTGLLLFSSSASALTANYNHIIDDQIFDYAGSMNASSIDAFLNSFPNSCISTNNGFSAPDPTGYSPATKFTYGPDVSAGTVIYHAAQAYGINPQVLLSTLQKEQGLVVGDGGNIVRNGTDCGALAISASMGYNCPDSQILSNYSGFELYAHNGVPVTSVNQTCVQHASYVGFSRQIIIASWQLTFSRHRSEGRNNWYVNKPNWDDSDDLGFCYSGYDVAGGPYYLCPDQASHANDPFVSHSGQYPIDNTVITMTDGATAALFDYTPHLHGQDLFATNFTAWFGSLTAAGYAWTTTGYTITSLDKSVAYDPGHLQPGQTYLATFEALNMGSSTWTNNGYNPVTLGTALGESSPFCNGTWVACNRPAYLQEASVAPGQETHPAVAPGLHAG